MSLKTTINSVLPQKFFGFIPLYIGVEIIMGISILNKVGGAYGFLSIVTGHPINFFQWSYNILCMLVLPFYITTLVSLNKCKLPENIRKVCLSTVIYLIDTLVGALYTVYFVFFWFDSEGSGAAKRALEKGFTAATKAATSAATPDLSSQSATELRELFLTSSATIIVTVLRVYFSLVILSFTKGLLKYSSEGHPVEVDEQSFDSSYKGQIRRFIYKSEVRCKNELTSFFQ